MHIKKRLKDRSVIGDFRLDTKIVENLAVATEGFVGAEIEHVVVSALFEAFSEERSITVSDFEKAIRNTIPLSVTQSEQIRSLREWANVRAVAASRNEDRVGYQQDVKSKDLDVSAARGGRSVDF